MKKNKTRWFPNVYSLLFSFVILAAVLTWVIPAGSFERVTDGSITRVIPGTFTLTEKKPQGLWNILLALMKGFKNQASLIFMIFFVGAAVNMLEQTKAIGSVFSRIAMAVKGKEGIAVFCMMAFLSLGGATGVFGNVTLVLIPIGIVLSQAMGFDKALGMLMVFLGSFSGFNVGWANPSTVGVAQTIAELPMFSGFGMRLLFHAVNFIISFLLVYLYMKQIRKDPRKSLNYKPETGSYTDSNTVAEFVGERIRFKQLMSMLIMAAGIGIVMIGALSYQWNTDEIAAVFLGVAFLIGIINNRDLNATMNMFIKGCSQVVTAAFVVGFANAITVILSSGGILDTIVYYLSIPISHFGSVAGANIMLLANVVINFFITSGSGQASAVMPIMVPICDLTGITRQVAVQCFQFGDGFSNCVYPTVATLMGGLAFADISYGKYLKKVLPLFALQLVLAMTAITALQLIGWNG